ncbi:MAG: HAMP domain-containing sensor histidine kinase [Bacteroidota bacterium]
MKKVREAKPIDLYSNKSYFKWGVLIVSLVIGLSSIIYTNSLVDKIREREISQINLYAKTLEYIANDYDAQDYLFLLEDVIQSNQTIPVILTDEANNPKDYLNLPEADKIDEPKRRKNFLRNRIREMRNEHFPIKVSLRDDEGNLFGVQYIYYQNSYLLTQLRYYPYVQLSIILIFGLITFTLFNYSRSAEQNRVWVGLAKETAHQLGTPLSSLIAWIEYLKASYPADENIGELDKDIARLEMITARFSSIGSTPHLHLENVYDVVQSALAYLQNRLSSKISIQLTVFPNRSVSAQLNKDLFQWVMENLCKNAVDAMEGRGDIIVSILRVNEGKVAIDIRDTGKGIAKNRVSKIFQPGFTTKKRGWGLGLTLAKRIVENYHQGKIFVKKTEINKGTTFRILLNA